LLRRGALMPMLLMLVAATLRTGHADRRFSLPES